jgi:hypothetical protein
MKSAEQLRRYRAVELAVVLIVASVFTAVLAEDAPAAAASEEHEKPSPEYTLLEKGRHWLETGDPERAITVAFDPVIEHFESAYQGTKSRVYSAQSMQQAILYSVLPGPEQQTTEVLDGVWANAYLLKGYALLELKNARGAQHALEAAVALSPMNSQYLAELAYAFQVQGDCDKSIATYAQAESAAALGSDDETKTRDVTRALRGQGYCLIEQGKLTEAETMYKKSLSLDPGDKKALGELKYIESQRKK